MIGSLLLITSQRIGTRTLSSHELCDGQTIHYYFHPSINTTHPQPITTTTIPSFYCTNPPERHDSRLLYSVHLPLMHKATRARFPEAHRRSRTRAAAVLNRGRCRIQSAGVTSIPTPKFGGPSIKAWAMLLEIGGREVDDGAGGWVELVR
jgi:hypothetical protein